MKVLQICSYYLGTNLYKQLFGTFGREVQNDVYVFCNEKEDVHGKEENVVIAPCFSSLDRAFFHLKHRKVLRDVQRHFDFSSYDVLHAHSLFSNGYIAYQLSLKHQKPYIVAVRNTDVNVFFKWMMHLRGLGREILQHAAAVVFISPAYLEYTIETYVPAHLAEAVREKAVVIPNGINAFWLDHQYTARKRPKEQTVRFVYVGELRDNKNIHTTVAVCQQLMAQGYDVSYHIIGRIVEEKYEAVCKQHDFITYTPYSPKEEIVDYYRKADIFIMPSKYETFGLVYAEALSQALPVIYTRGQGFDGYFEDGKVGYAVKHDDVSEIVARVKDILGNYDEIAQNCLEGAEVFDWGKITDVYERLYEKAARKEVSK